MKSLNAGAGEMANMVKCLPHKPEGLSSILQHRVKATCRARTCNPSVGRQTQEDPWGLLARLAKLVSS